MTRKGHFAYTIVSMTITIISPGKGHAPYYVELIKEYETRMRGSYTIEWVFPKIGTVEEESIAILRRIMPSDTVVLLDERGKAFSSETFASLVSPAEARTGRLIILIGGAFGVNSEIRARATSTISLSAMVLPHMLVRLLLTEQLYRAHSILTNGKYHHA